MESPDGQMFMKFSSVVCRLDDNPQVMPLALSRPVGRPAALGHARAVILWGGFSVEVDGGSNRGAYQAAWANLRARSQSRAGAFGFLN